MIFFGRFVAWLGRSTTIRRLALASLIANVGIVVTGGAVRLTASGLGCPTVPKCTEDSLVPTRQLGVHGAIEFGNRQLTFVLGTVALLTLVSALRQQPRRRNVIVLAAAALAVIPAQALIGFATVLTDLNPWVVGWHFLVSMGAIATTYLLWRRCAEPVASGERPVPAPLRHLAWLLTAVAGAVLVAGVVVTGAGPHAGDAKAKRNGLDLESVTQLHVDGVFLLLGLSIAMWLAVRATGASAQAVRAAAVLVGVELSQGLIGFVQYFTNLPILLVGLHMLGAALVWLATVHLQAGLGRRPAGREPVPDPLPAVTVREIVTGADVPADVFAKPT